jgi:hypothetical protein
LENLTIVWTSLTAGVTRSTKSNYITLLNHKYKIKYV